MGKEKEIHATPQEVWDGINELRKAQTETDRQMKETDRQMKETDQRMAETDRQIKKTDLQLKEQAIITDRRLKKLDELFSGQWGKLMEALVEGDLIKLLKDKKIEVERTLQNIKGEREGEKWEIDILAINGKEVVVVEVKTTLTVKHVDHFIEKVLKDFTNLNPEYKSKKIYGAVAYLKADQNSDSYAQKGGLFVIRATGSSASITNKQEFIPKDFS